MLGAVLNGSDFIAATGSVFAAPTYTNDTWASANNTTVTQNDSPSSGATTNSLAFNNGTLYTVTLAGINTVASGGIVVGSTATNGAHHGGTLGLASSDSWVRRPTFTIGSVIANNGGATGLTKGGTATLTLAGVNVFTGRQMSMPAR